MEELNSIKTSIIPQEQYFVGQGRTINKEAICIFLATGFFLDQDTFYNELFVLKPAHDYILSKDNSKILSSTPYFEWYHEPQNITFDTAVEQFSELFEKIISEQSRGMEVILPLSGGLDSRTQAAAMHYLDISPQTYTYSYPNGHDELFYGREIAKICGFEFEAYQVGKGYLWDSIYELAKINQCYSEFTHPRQMAFVNQFEDLGNSFSLGHWGDVLFDDSKVFDGLSFDNQVITVIKKILKKGGKELADSLWNEWKLGGTFYDYLFQRVEELMKSINITTSANARIRAFKSLYWAPRWTSVNLSVFKSIHPIFLPYYDDRMCNLICQIPEKFLSDRKIQIEYIKRRLPRLAKLRWQENKPFNLYNYHLNKLPYTLPYKVYNKLKRYFNTNSYIQRNWEIQFLGESNEKILTKHLFENTNLNELIPEDIIRNFYDKFNLNPVNYSHPVSMLLTLSLFSEISKAKNV